MILAQIDGQPVVTVTKKFESRRGRADYLMLSDVHLDNAKCDRGYLKELLHEAQEREACVLLGGDTLDLMQGKTDRRSAKSALMNEHKVSAYVDEVIEEAAEFFAPFGLPMVVLDGNHESALLNKLETNPTRRLARELERLGVQAVHGGYQCHVRFYYGSASGGSKRSVHLAFHHGAWGGKITKGVLSVTRYASIFPGADIVWSGHTHDSWHVIHPQFVVTKDNKQVIRNQHHLKTSTMKDEFSKGSGWATEKLVFPAPVGGYFMRHDYLRSDTKGVNVSVNFESRLRG